MLVIMDEEVLLLDVMVVVGVCLGLEDVVAVIEAERVALGIVETGDDWV